MIPKTIHYCWFGNNPLPEKEIYCMNSWREKLVDYQIKRWDENNSPLDHPFVKKMYKKKQWAFVSDYVRLYAIYHEGGIYLDTDMEVLKSLDNCLEYNCFFGFEDESNVNAAIFGAIAKNLFIKKCLNFYDSLNYEVNIPKVITHLLQENGLNKYGNQMVDDVKIFSSDFFYPWPYNSDFEISMIKENSLSLHHWSKNWKIKRNIFEKIVLKVNSFFNKHISFF